MTTTMKNPKQRLASASTNKQMPRLLWNDGITNLTDVTANLKVGIMFTIVVVSLTSEGRAYFAQIFDTPKQLLNMQICFQMILCYWMWLKKPTYWSRKDTQSRENARNSIRIMLT